MAYGSSDAGFRAGTAFARTLAPADIMIGWRQWIVVVRSFSRLSAWGFSTSRAASGCRNQAVASGLEQRMSDFF